MRIDARSSLNPARGFLARGAVFGAVAIDGSPASTSRRGKDIENFERDGAFRIIKP